MKKNIKKIFLILILLILLLFLGYFVVIAKKYKNSIDYYKNIATITDNNKNTEDQWSTYHDEKYGFSINYQSGIDVTTVYNHRMTLSTDNTKYKVINGGVNFSFGGGPGISVEIYDDNQFSSLEEWLNALNKEKVLSHYIIDSKQTIEGYPAISVKEIDNNGEGQTEYNYTQITAFLRNKQLFVIFTGSDNTRDLILNSFKFDK